MRLFGILLILNALAITGWFLASGGISKWQGTLLISLCGLAVLAGAALTFQDRLTELTIKGVGTIRAAAEHACHGRGQKQPGWAGLNAATPSGQVGHGRLAMGDKVKIS